MKNEVENCCEIREGGVPRVSEPLRSSKGPEARSTRMRRAEHTDTVGFISVMLSEPRPSLANLGKTRLARAHEDALEKKGGSGPSGAARPASSRRSFDRCRDARWRSMRLEDAGDQGGARSADDKRGRREEGIRSGSEAHHHGCVAGMNDVERRRITAVGDAEVDRRAQVLEERRRRERRRRTNVTARSGGECFRRDEPNGQPQRENKKPLRQAHDAYFASIRPRSASVRGIFDHRRPQTPTNSRCLARARANDLDAGGRG